MKTSIKNLILNPKNPRMISYQKLIELVCSIITFPEMLDYRNIIVDEGNVIIGGNQRVRALQKILEYSNESIIAHLKKCNQSDQWVKQKAEFWDKWKKDPVVSVEVVSLSDDEKVEYIVKDNSDFGEWDNEKLKMFYEDVVELPTMFIDINEVSTKIEESDATPISEFNEKDVPIRASETQRDDQTSDTDNGDFDYKDTDEGEQEVDYDDNDFKSSDENYEDDETEGEYSENGDVDIQEELKSMNTDAVIAEHIKEDFVDYFVLNNERIAVTQSELDSFKKAMYDYADKFGSSIGFINYLKNGVRNN